MKRNVLIVIFVSILACILLSQHGFFKIADRGRHLVLNEINDKIFRNMNKYEIYPTATYYYILPENEYREFLRQGVTPRIILPILFNIIFNFLFQPIFLCVFTPQVILIYLLFPFFMYGCIRDFKKIPLMIIFFFAFGFYIGLRDSVVEALIRHRMTCDLIYLLIGVAGLIRWTTDRS